MIDSADTMSPASGSTTNERCTVLSDPDHARRAHPLLQTWRTRLHHQNTRSSIDQLLLARITWALTVAHLTPDSYRSAADRAVATALAQAAGRPIVEIDIACVDPALLSTAATAAPGSAEIAYSYLDQEPTPWPSTDIDLVEVTVTTDDPTADTLIGRGWAAPDWLSTGQVRFYDLLRADRMTPAQALARVRRVPGRSVQAGHARRRTARRRIRLRYPRPHPALHHWLHTLTAQAGADPELLAQLRWVTGRTGCLTRQAYTDAAHRAIAAACTAGERDRLLTVGAARTDLVPHRQPIAIIAAVSGPVPVDQVIVYRSGSDTPAGVAWAVPAGLHQHQVGRYESHRAAGLTMRDSYRHVAT